MGKAGLSAFRQAAKLTVDQVKLAGRWGAGVGAAAVGAGFYLSSELLPAATVGGVAGVATTAIIGCRPTGASRWIQGGKAERRTARRLKSLRRRGWWVTHDLSIPRSKANLDHVAVHPSGRWVVYLDTKSTRVTGQLVHWEPSQRRLMFGRFDRTSQLNTVKWEASKIQDAVGVPVIPVIVCDGHRVNGPYLLADQCYLVESAGLVDFLRSARFEGSDSPAAARSVRNAVKAAFPSK